MQRAATIAVGAVTSLSKTSGTLSRFTTAKLPTQIPDEGIALHELYDATLPPAGPDDFAWAHGKISVNYGVEPIAIKDRFELVKELVIERGWSSHRFRAAVKNMIATKPFATWTVSDILSFESEHKLRPYHNRNLPVGPAEIYRIGDRLFWREPDATELPFERVTPGKHT